LYVYLNIVQDLQYDSSQMQVKFQDPIDKMFSFQFNHFKNIP
jgi:hypothetical protein